MWFSNLGVCRIKAAIEGLDIKDWPKVKESLDNRTFPQ